MIICKPSNTAVLALGGFFLLCYAVLLLAFSAVLTAAQPSLMWLIIIIIMFTLLLFFTVKLLFGYINIAVNEGKIIVSYVAIGKKRHFTLQQLINTEEVCIKTFQRKEYRQLTLFFPGEKFTVNNQVYTNYDKLKSYLQQKKSKKKK